jgi:hypothetical protein
MRMVAISAAVLTCNRARVDKYMCNNGLDVVDLIVRALRAQDDEDNGLMAHLYVVSFSLQQGPDSSLPSNDYIAGEEARLIEGLERFHWEIDPDSSGAACSCLSTHN